MQGEFNQKIFGFLACIIGVIIGIFGIKGIMNDNYVDSMGIKIGVSIVIFLVALGMVVLGVYLIRKEKEEKSDDQRRESASTIINTKFKEIRSYYYDRTSCYFVITSWINPDDHKLYLFKSDDIGYDATEFIKANDITEFPVTYEAGNIKNYKIDITKIKRGEL